MASGVTGVPGANPGGNQNLVPTTGGSPTPAIGGATNPLNPAFPAGGAMPTSTNPTQALMGTNVAGLMGANTKGKWNPRFLKDAGFTSGAADLLTAFLKNGAGFNPEVANALIASMQPQVERGTASILEQFGSMGLRGGTPAAVGLGDFLGQVNLNEGQIFAQLYEQSVQNYMNVLMGAKKPTTNTMAGLGSLMGGAGQLGQGIGSIIGASGGAAAAGGAAAGGGSAAATGLEVAMGFL